MIKAVIFDMFETLVTIFHSRRYSGRKIASDLPITEQKFREIWDVTEDDRTLGIMTFEEVIEEILRVNHIYSAELFEKIVAKRKEGCDECFQTMHPQIIPMLEELKKENIKIGLITNCFLEEKNGIEKSELYKYFDAVCMSCDLRLKKPDTRIFEACLEKLMLSPEECLYVGDGGSKELETARKLGMQTLQAVWYLREDADQPSGRKPEFRNAESPMDVCNVVKEQSGL